MFAMDMLRHAIALDIFINEPDEVYHAKGAHYLSSHQLMDFIKCPFLHHQKKLGLVVEKETEAYRVGKAAHVRILEGRDTFQERYCMDWPCNADGEPMDGRTKAVKEWKAKQVKYPIQPKDSAMIEQMAMGVGMSDAAVERIAYGLAEGVVRVDYCGLPCQIRIDWFNPLYGIVDLKTCDDLTYFEADARRYRYLTQLAFYQAVLKEAAGVLVPVFLIAVEKKTPFRCGVWRVSDDSLAAARRDNEAAIERLISCRTENVWPTGYEEIRLLDVI
jgi:hypothetical protein